MPASKPRSRSVYSCIECGTAHPKWAGRCDGCGEWNTVVEEPDAPAATAPGGEYRRPVKLADVAAAGSQPWPTSIAEFDRVLNGGLCPGSVTLIGGEPGIGKSTLLIQLLDGAGPPDSNVLYVTAEESAEQVRNRAKRVGVDRDHLFVTSETAISSISAAIDDLEPSVVVVDSVQAVSDETLTSAPGSVAQVRQCGHLLAEQAKRSGCALVLVGHVTKEGSLAGPRVLEHLVDTVITFEGDRHTSLRFLRAVKHRFGATSEVGIFSMEAGGLAAVRNPSELFLSDRRSGASGSVVVATLSGRRPLLVEVQSLFAQTKMAQPRRSVSGVDGSRLAMILAVLGSHLAVPVNDHEVYVSVVGGARVTEPASDIGLAMAMVSAWSGEPVADDVVMFGEVGLGGEVRGVAGVEHRLAEASKLGFRRAIVPESVERTEDISLIAVSDVGDAARRLGLLDRSGGRHGV